MFSTFLTLLSQSLSTAVGVAVGATSDALVGVFSWLPEGQDLPNPVHTAFAEFGSYLALLNFIVPAQTLLIVMGLVVGIEIILLGWRFLMRIAYFVRGTSV